MPIYTANCRGAIRKALEDAGMKFDDQNGLDASVNRLRSFLINPQAAFETWQKNNGAASTQSASATSADTGSAE